MESLRVICIEVIRFCWIIYYLYCRLNICEWLNVKQDELVTKWIPILHTQTFSTLREQDYYLRNLLVFKLFLNYSGFCIYLCLLVLPLQRIYLRDRPKLTWTMMTLNHLLPLSIHVKFTFHYWFMNENCLAWLGSEIPSDWIARPSD